MSFVFLALLLFAVNESVLIYVLRLFAYVGTAAEPVDQLSAQVLQFNFIIYITFLKIFGSVVTGGSKPSGGAALERDRNPRY